ncbi:acyltransferase [Robertmurraya sp. GLU-23]
MIRRLKNFIQIKLGKTSPEELTVKTCLNMGMKVGENCHGLFGSTIDVAHCWLIEIGDNVTFAPQVYLLAHDASTKRYLDYTKIAKLKIEDNVFIGARALIMPGVSIGKNSIVAAGSVVTRSVPENSVVGGNPAKLLAKTEEYIDRHRENMKLSKTYNYEWTVGGNITPSMCKQMTLELEDTVGYVK